MRRLCHLTDLVYTPLVRNRREEVIRLLEKGMENGFAE
jgi:hypothetical protein